MAHFGVQKAKKLLAMAGVTAIAGAGLMSTGNAGAITALSGSEYDCSMDDGAGHYAILLKTANAIKWAIKDQEEFYKPGADTCYVDWSPSLDQYEANPNSVKFYIAGGNYEFNDFTSRGDDSNYSGIYIGNIPDVFEAGEHTHVSDANVVFSATSSNNGFDSTDLTNIGIDVAENSSLTINSGKYTTHISNGGTFTINDGQFVDSSLRNISNGTFTINNGTFTSSDAGSGGRYITNTNNMTIKNGTFSGENHDYNINIVPLFIDNSGTLTIEDGEYSFDFTQTDGIGTAERPYYGDPGAFIRNTGDLTIRDGDFSGKGTLINELGDSGSINIRDGNFEANYMISTHGHPNAPVSNSTINITGGVFHSKKTFYLYDDRDNLPQDQGIDDASGTWGLWRDSDGDARGGMCTGPNCSSPWTFGTFANQRVKGGDYSDGEHIEPESGFAKVYLPTDYDNDGKKDARIVPKAGPVSDNVDLGQTKELFYHVKDGSSRPSFPENSRIMSQTNTEYCSAEFIGGRLYVTGHKYTEGVASKFCHVLVTDDSSYVLEFSINTKPETDYSYTNADPIVIPEGESKTPDGYDGDPEDYEWITADGKTYCTVNNGTITAIKGGGDCTIVARNPETKEVIIWTVTTTSPIEIGVGESKKPEDLPEGADNGEWSSSDTSVCTVASDGTITGVKAGTCKVTLKLEDGTVYTWIVTISENPNTSDSSRVTAFTAAGAAIGGLTAIFATVRRFFGRK